MVVKRACGINPPSASAGVRRSIALRANLKATIRTRFVVGSNEGPAVRAHAPFFHLTHCNGGPAPPPHL